MMKRITRMLSAALGVILSISMLISTLPITAFATEVGAGNGGGEMPTGDVAAFEATGDGTEANPWKISDVDSLYAFASMLNNENNGYYGRIFELTADITMPEGSVWYGIREFNGTLKGNGHTIRNLTITSNGSGNVGFIKNTLYFGTTITDLNFSDVTLSVDHSCSAGVLVGSAYYIVVSGCNVVGTVTASTDNFSSIGGLIGSVDSVCRISNSTYSGAITLGNGTAGGLVGGAGTQGYINSCVTKGSITSGDGNVGGLVGRIFDTRRDDVSLSIYNNRNELNINSEGCAGGLVGELDIGGYSTEKNNICDVTSIKQCINSGHIESESVAGGLIGSVSASLNISTSVNKGAVKGNKAGGVCGDLYLSSEESAQICNCYNNGFIEAGGGIVGEVGFIYEKCALTITDCYSNSHVMSWEQYGIIQNTAILSGDIILEDLYIPTGMIAYLEPTSGVEGITATNVMHLSEEEMLQQKSFVGFDFDSIWKMAKNGPALQWETDVDMGEGENPGDKGDTGNKGDHSGTEEGGSTQEKTALNGMSWPLLNDKSSFYEGDDNATDFKNYFVNTDLFSDIYIFFNIWLRELKDGNRGWCHGLSLLSVAEANGQTDIKSVTGITGSTLCEYGYSGYGSRDGKTICTADKDLSRIIERAQYCQFSSQIKKAQTEVKISKIDKDIYATIKAATETHAIAVDMRYVYYDYKHEKVTGSHTVAIPRGAEVIDTGESYKVEIYDPNAPQVDAEKLFGIGSHYSDFYKKPTSFIEFNYTDNKVFYSHSIGGIWMADDVERISFTDTTKLDPDFFYGKYTLSDNDHTRVFYTTENITVSNDEKKTLFQKQNGNLICEDVICHSYSGASEGSSGLGTIEWIDVPNGVYQIDLTENAMAMAVSDNDKEATSIVSDGNLQVTIGEDRKITLKATDSAVTFKIATTVGDGKNASVKGELNECESLEIEEKNGIVQGKTNSTGSVEGSVYKGDDIFQYDIDFSHDEGKQDVPEGIYGGKGEIIGTTDAMEYRSTDQVDSEWIACSNESTTADPGNYEVRYAAKDNLEASEAVRVTVLPKDEEKHPNKQNPPEGISGNKGMIKGTTTKMEYRPLGTDEWTTCDDESTSVQPGDYEVRYAATEDKEASESVRVTVPKEGDEKPAKGQQNPPEGIAGGKGEITGTTTDMEYRKLGDVKWTRCDNDATSADPGDYEVRYAETDEKEPSSAVQVTVQAKSDNKKEDISGGSTSANNQSTSRRSNAAVEKQSHTHQYEWKTVKEATEDQNGEADYICVECGDVAYRSPISSFYIYNQNVAKSIRNCPKNGIVNVDATKRDWISFSSMFSQALQERPDVTVVLRYNYGAGTCKMTIPAGSYQIVQELFDKDGTKDKNGHGLFCGYLNLATKFSVVQMK